MSIREKNLERLKKESFDVLVIGGGATGSGIALDASTRGLRVGLIDRGDFSSGTSSRSTKLLHGGMRYLEKAILKGDRGQLGLVYEALKERFILLRQAPYLSRVLPIVIPLYSWSDAAYYIVGMKIYEWLSRKFAIGKTSFLSRKTMQKSFPSINLMGLKGGIQFFDGQFDDARLNISLVLTAMKQGAAAVNYVEVVNFEKNNKKISSVQVKDHLSDELFSIRSKVFINATGPFSDTIRKLDERGAKPLLAPSCGTHIVLDKHLVPNEKGLLIPQTEDGRVLFVLPWQGGSLVGTTEEKTAITFNPMPQPFEIDYLLTHLKKHLGYEIKKSEIKAAWTGIRPLVAEEGKKESETSREFKMVHSDSGLYSIIGGKWTSYRKMAEVMVDELLKKEFDKYVPCSTENLILMGGEGYRVDLSDIIAERFGLEKDIAEHLATSYGNSAFKVIQFCRDLKKEERLIQGFPYLLGEIDFAFQHEMACTLDDVLYRRLRLGMLNQKMVEEVKKIIQRKDAKTQKA